MKIVCPYCGCEADKPAGYVNRARKSGLPIYCSRKHYGLARRKFKPKVQKVAEKRVYDMEYRRRNRAHLKTMKRAYFQRTYDPVKAAERRKARMTYHIQYCRDPAYKRWKSRYDRAHRAQKMFGPYAESFLVLQKVEKEIASRMSNYDIRLANGTLNKAQLRRRAYASLISG